MSNLAYGTFTITNLSVVTSVDVYYYNSTSSSSLSGGSWQTTTPTWTNGKYIWSKTVTTWEQGVTTQSKPVCITGQKGSTGLTGQSVTSIVEQYALSTSNTTAPTTGWSNTMPPFEANKYYWTRSKITWANPTNTTYTDAVLANGITSANTTANAANTTATQANQTANTANQTANAASQTAAQAASAAAAAQSTANDATSIANGKNTIYYGANFPAGGTYKAGDTFFKQTAEGYIIYKYDTTDNQWVKESLDEQGITQITNAKIANLDGGKINAGTITSLKLSTDAIKSRNYQAGTAPYSGAGTFLDLTQGNIYTPNFGVNNDSLDSIDDGAYIRGSIYAHKGTIGQSSTNYWYIGNYKDYNQVNSAMIKGYGTATIQLGESNTWRLNTNRIHTAWNDDSSANEAYRLHYLTRDSKYWDMGLHVPTAGIDKFIYIRSSKSDTSTANILENLQNSLEDNLDGTNNYWTYKFFISADGGIYARNIYAIDENGNYTLISGANGAYLLKSGGTIQNNLVINGTLQVKGNYLNKNGSALTLQTNLGSTTAGTLTGNTTSAISIGVTGTLPSSNGGTGNTNWNQGGVVYIDGSSPKKLLSTAAGTSGYLLKSNGTGAPTWINPATLTVAAATKATQDGDGNVIKTTYLKLSGGNVTGPVSFGDSVSVDDLNAGTLVVTGNASFANNIQANTINGVTVGSSPKFTDTVTTVTTSGNGNAVTAITASGGKLTVTKGTTFLTSFTQSDPIFTASVAASIKQTDINNWNSKTSNTGTVTSVAASGSGGITISGSPITTSGTLAIGLNLSTAINGLGEGTSAANRNDYAVVQYAGGGTTTTSYHRRKLSNVFAALNSSDITTALGFTPYNATNPNGYTSNPGTVTSVRVQASSPLQSSTSTAQSSSLNTTISFVNQNANVVLAGPSSGSAAAPAFRALVAADIPSLTKSKISDFPTTWALSSVTGADDLKAIEVLEGTSGLLKKTGANTWQLDTNTYVTSSGVTSITLTQGTGISIGSSGTAITSTGTRTISLANNYGDTKNPYASKTARYVLAAPAAQAGAPTFRALTKDDVGLNNILNIKQVTGIGQGENGKIRVFKGSGTNDYEDIAVEIVATSTSSVASSQKLTSYGGSATQPVYFPADGANAGKPVAISYTIEKSVPSNAVFTDTWNKVSTSQDGYVTKLPGNTTTFLRGDGSWGTPVDTTYTFDGTYNASTNKAATVSTVTNAINALDGNLNNTTPGAGKTLTAFSQTDGKISATFGNISITKSQISDFPSSMAPTAHTHAYIVTEGDNRSVATTPNDYTSNGGRPNRIVFRGLKANSYINSPSSDTYSYLVGLRGWSDDSGGNAHEIAFNNNGIFRRNGGTDTWGSWYKLIDSGNYNSYSPTLTGTGASGTWGISISGNAATATIATTATKANITTVANSIAKYSDTSGTFTDSYITIDSSGNLIIGDNDHPANIKMGAKNDNYGLMPNVNNYGQIGSSSLYWYRGYINNYYGTNSHVNNWDSNKNIGTAATSSASSTLGNVNFYNTCAAGGTQTKTKLAADISTASDITVTLPSETGKLALTKNYQPYAHYSNTNVSNSGKYYKISINSYIGWMLSFTIRIYHTYRAYDLQISGFNYGSRHWYSPSAIILGSSVTTSINVLFGYDSNDHLWVAIPAEQYTGIDVVNVTNGYSQVDSLEGLFTIEMVDGEPTTVQDTKTAYRPWYRNETVTTAGALTNKTLDSLTLNSTAGTFSFQGGGVPWDGTDWVGLQVGSNDDKFQIHALNGTTLEYRQNDSGGTNSNWGDWYSLLSAGNYTDYTVTKTGSGASGTWGISITGNAANVTGTVVVGHGGTGVTSFTSGELLIGNGSNAIGTRAIKNMTTKGNLGWTANGTDIYIPTINTLAYWDGRYNSTTSNLTYCVKGAFGDAAIKGVVTTLDASANLPTASAVKTYVDTTAQNTYVTLTTEQTITGRKTFSNLAAVTFKPSSGTDKCNVNYDASLGALVFSF